MELYQLKSFVTVAREGNLTRASEKLFTSLPAVSAQIKALEDEFGVQLFRRSARGMSLTDAGTRLLAEAERTLAAASQVKAAANEARGDANGIVRMGTVTDPVALRLGDALVLLASRHPGVSLRLEQGISGTVMSKLRSGDLDCGYVIAAEKPADLPSHRLGPVELVVALPHRLKAKAAGMTLEDVLDLPWIGTPPPCSMRQQAEALFREAGREYRFTTVADVEASVRSMIASGLGAGIMRRDQALDAQRAREAVIWNGWSAEASLFWVTSSGTASAAALTLAAVRDCVLEAWGAGAG
ncbi:MAG: LysR family transcriptional regulator [Betaproteobacteria bacterium]|nr:LysR family transcriptional regulator [Betaproteobacteria bacterium]